MASLPDSARAVLQSPALAHLVTLNPDGSPQVTVVWVGLDGTARITEGGAAGLLQELAHTYLGPGVRFPPADDPPPGYITHIKVNRVSGVGPWAAGH